MGKSNPEGRTKPCREYGCRHKKHGYTRKDRPDPSSRIRTKPRPKTDEEIKALAESYLLVRYAEVAEEPVLSGELVA